MWHTETCISCQAIYDEKSDPAASMHLCTKCLHLLWNISTIDAPLQKSVAADDWWMDHVYAYERDLALGLIDETGRRK